MANEIRIRQNNTSGTISDNPLAIGATTINSPGFADLPVVDATSHLILILDPLEVGGTAEIVMVTAHTAAATSVTVLRGQEGSVARSHVFNTTWFHGPTVRDFDVKAGGQLGYAQTTTSQGGITGVEVDLTGLAVTVIVPANRRVRITAKAMVASTDATTRFIVFLKEGTTYLQRMWDGGSHLAGVSENMYGAYVTTPSVGSHTYKLTIDQVSGAGTVGTEAGADFPAYILVEDIGSAV
jgi:hypothetical protein